jgi:hypothetical protein
MYKVLVLLVIIGVLLVVVIKIDIWFDLIRWFNDMIQIGIMNYDMIYKYEIWYDLGLLFNIVMIWFDNNSNNIMIRGYDNK